MRRARIKWVTAQGIVYTSSMDVVSSVHEIIEFVDTNDYLIIKQDDGSTVVIPKSKLNSFEVEGV